MELIITLLVSAVQLLTLVTNSPNLPQSVRDNANQVANTAIVYALAHKDAMNVPSPVLGTVQPSTEVSVSVSPVAIVTPPIVADVSTSTDAHYIKAPASNPSGDWCILSGSTHIPPNVLDGQYWDGTPFQVGQVYWQSNRNGTIYISTDQNYTPLYKYPFDATTTSGYKTGFTTGLAHSKDTDPVKPYIKFKGVFGDAICYSSSESGDLYF